jgi:hypothetical protein
MEIFFYGENMLTIRGSEREKAERAQRVKDAKVAVSVFCNSYDLTGDERQRLENMAANGNAEITEDVLVRLLHLIRARGTRPGNAAHRED